MNRTQIILGLLIVTCLSVNAAAVNDIADKDIDDMNFKEDFNKPLAKNLISQKQLISMSAIAAFLALGISLFVSLLAFAITLIGLLANCAYSCRPLQLSSRGAIGLISLSMCYVLEPFLISLVISKEKISTQLFLYMLTFVFIFLSRLSLKDFRDIKGDKKYGKITFLLRHGIKATCLLSGMALVIALALLGVIFYKSFIVIAIILFFAAFILNILKSLAKTQTYAQQLPYLTILNIAYVTFSMFISLSVVIF